MTRHETNRIHLEALTFILLKDFPSDFDILRIALSNGKLLSPSGENIDFSGKASAVCFGTSLPEAETAILPN